MSIELGEKVAIVTGAGSGIGAATAESLANAGAAVALVDLIPERSDDVARSLTQRGRAAIGLGADVGVADQVAAAVATVVDYFGGVDILINNAGVCRYGRVDELSESDWDLVLNTNLKGAFLFSKNVIPVMRSRGGGAIVNTASVQAFASQELVAAYAASKGGLISLTKTLALDHASDGIRVNGVAPGSVRTGMAREAAEKFSPDAVEAALTEWGEHHPIGFLAEPGDVAEVIAFLASDHARYVTGAIVAVDGGLGAKLAV